RAARARLRGPARHPRGGSGAGRRSLRNAAVPRWLRAQGPGVVAIRHAGGRNGDRAMTIVSAALLLFLILDPLGNIPIFLGLLRTLPPERQRKVLVRELLIALGVL